jgi:hypothetical protein
MKGPDFKTQLKRNFERTRKKLFELLYFFKNSSLNIINRVMIYKAFPKPILEYGLVVGAHKETYLLRLQPKENIILKVLFRCARSTSTERLLFLCGLENEKDDSKDCCLIFLKKQNY